MKAGKALGFVNPFKLVMPDGEVVQVSPIIQAINETILAMPDHLPARVLSAGEASAVKKVCAERLSGASIKGAVDDFARFCVLLSRPENHVLIATGQYIEKQVNRRTEADMVNEVVRELTALEKFTAFAKLLSRSEKIRTRQLPEPLRNREISFPEAEGRYRRKRTEIEAEIAARQEGWRAAVSDEPPATHAVDEQVEAEPRAVGSAGIGGPPPQFTGGEELESTPPEAPEGGDEPEDELQAEEQCEPAQTEGGEADVNQAAGQALQYRLVYKSDFFAPSVWDEDFSDKVSVFRKNGYYHMRLLEQDYYAFVHPAAVLSDFVAQVDCEFVKRRSFSPKCSCGIVFSITEDDTFCAFTVSGDGLFSITSCRNGAHDWISQWQESEYIRQGSSANTLLIARKGEAVTLWINGHDVASVSDYRFTRGMVGIFVSNGLVNSVAEARFINFEVSAIE